MSAAQTYTLETVTGRIEALQEQIADASSTLWRVTQAAKSGKTTANDWRAYLAAMKRKSYAQTELAQLLRRMAACDLEFEALLIL